jgi:hypothetical protein
VLAMWSCPQSAVGMEPPGAALCTTVEPYVTKG